jgi:hypothetical protein
LGIFCGLPLAKLFPSFTLASENLPASTNVRIHTTKTHAYPGGIGYIHARMHTTKRYMNAYTPHNHPGRRVSNTTYMLLFQARHKVTAADTQTRTQIQDPKIAYVHVVKVSRT